MKNIAIPWLLMLLMSSVLAFGQDYSAVAGDYACESIGGKRGCMNSIRLRANGYWGYVEYSGKYEVRNGRVIFVSGDGGPATWGSAIIGPDTLTIGNVVYRRPPASRHGGDNDQQRPAGPAPQERLAPSTAGLHPSYEGHYFSGVVNGMGHEWYFNSDGTYRERRLSRVSHFEFRGQFRVVGEYIEFTQSTATGGTVTPAVGRGTIVTGGTSQGHETRRLKFQMLADSAKNYDMELDGVGYWFSP
jgi:hypothetical protein